MSYTSTAVKTAYNKRTYQSYTIRLRYDKDQALIDKVEALKAQGLSATDAIKDLIGEIK